MTPTAATSRTLWRQSSVTVAAYAQEELRAIIAQPARTPSTKKSKPSRRSSPRSKEEWRHLDKYPGYQVSNYWRVRSASCLEDGGVLKPDMVWNVAKSFKGKAGLQPVKMYTLYVDGKRHRVQAGWLLVEAGFHNRPERRT